MLYFLLFLATLLVFADGAEFHRRRKRTGQRAIAPARRGNERDANRYLSAR